MCHSIHVFKNTSLKICLSIYVFLYASLYYIFIFLSVKFASSYLRLCIYVFKFTSWGTSRCRKADIHICVWNGTYGHTMLYRQNEWFVLVLFVLGQNSFLNQTPFWLHHTFACFRGPKFEPLANLRT